ncbi:MAG: carbohydrate deacetylase [Longicatena sp.]
MSKKLIINADDFGFSEAVNHGIIKGYQDGLITSTTIMANMPGFEHAMKLAAANPGLHCGVHLNLTCYKPILQTHKTLVRENGYFRKQGDVDGIDLKEAYEELKTQIEKVIAAGVPIDHLDSHHHIHSLPFFKEVMERLQKEYNLPFRGGFTYESPITRKSVLLVGFYDDGVSVENFSAMMKHLEDGKTYDLMCHPAYVDKFLYETTSYGLKRINELDMLCNEKLKHILKEENIILDTYASL